ncbi:hypothetical protein BpHYR1_026490 [Brachionus plicatilis]|uniref:Uncharacterized protein n=1 Tax=Brachionus plicatilis TaxID=10195 RepID=A0A3M7QGL0_BRAPC|nr:hypothetical protein BpHYR1_026490 [Brachionus plicatilis]
MFKAYLTYVNSRRQPKRFVGFKILEKIYSLSMSLRLSQLNQTHRTNSAILNQGAKHELFFNKFDLSNTQNSKLIIFNYLNKIPKKIKGIYPNANYRRQNWNLKPKIHAHISKDYER